MLCSHALKEKYKKERILEKEEEEDPLHARTLALDLGDHLDSPLFYLVFFHSRERKRERMQKRRQEHLLPHLAGEERKKGSSTIANKSTSILCVFFPCLLCNRNCFFFPPQKAKEKKYRGGIGLEKNKARVYVEGGRLLHAPRREREREI